MRKLFLLLIFIGIMSNTYANAEIDHLRRLIIKTEAQTDLSKEIKAIKDDYFKQERTIEELIGTKNLLKNKINETIKKESFFDSEIFKYEFEAIELFYKTEEKLINNRNMLSAISYKDEIVEIILKNIVDSKDSFTIILSVMALTKDQLIKANTERYYEYENELGGISVASYPKGITLIDQHNNKYELSSITQYPKNKKLRYGKNFYFLVRMKEKLLDAVEHFKLTIDKNTLGNVNPITFSLKKEMILNEDIFIWRVYNRYVED